MSGVAKKSKIAVDSPTMYKPKDTVSFSFTKDSTKMPLGCMLDKEVVLIVRGTVTSLRGDEYGQSLGLNVKSVEKKNA